MRKPFIVEFTGTPEAGKTTVIKRLYIWLTRMGYRVKLYPESAELTPSIFPKGCLEAKLWMNFNTAKNVVESHFLSDYDIVIFDRGLYDIMFWSYFDSIYNYDIATKNANLSSFLENYPPDLLIAFFVSEEESIKRRGGEGRLVTKEFVSNYNKVLKTFINSIGINKVIVSTDNKQISTVVETVRKTILENMPEP